MKNYLNPEEIPEELLPELELDPDPNDEDLSLILNPKNGWVWILKEDWKDLSPTQTKILKDKFRALLNKEEQDSQLKQKLLSIKQLTEQIKNNHQQLDALIKELQNL